MRRTSDVVARFGDDEFVALGVAMEQASACAFAEGILGRIRSLAIHHPRSRTGRFLTMSAGVVSAVPPRGRDCEVLLDAAERALERAKHAGGNRVEGGASEEPLITIPATCPGHTARVPRAAAAPPGTVPPARRMRR